MAKDLSVNISEKVRTKDNIGPDSRKRQRPKHTFPKKRKNEKN